MKRGFACGVFDLFHPGHVRMLKECKENCDYLIVAVNKATDLPPEKNPPVMNYEERMEVLGSCKYVDEVLSYEGENELYELMKSLDIQVRFLGEDYRDKPITGADLELPIHYTDRSHGYSTTGMRERLSGND